MKRLKLFLGAAALAAVALTASPAVNAQENGNRDENGKIVRGPYQTNAFGDNWFIGAGGGINVFLMDGYKTNIGPSIDAGFGKWFTPAVGMRIGYSGQLLSTKASDITSRMLRHCAVIGVSGEWLSVSPSKKIPPKARMIHALYE